VAAHFKEALDAVVPRPPLLETDERSLAAYHEAGATSRPG
jgi:hypothetical protein